MKLTELYRQACDAPTPRQKLMNDISEATGAGPDTVRSWVEGRRTPRKEMKSKIAGALHIEETELFPQ